jgi:hypothetical protein
MLKSKKLEDDLKELREYSQREIDNGNKNKK